MNSTDSNNKIRISTLQLLMAIFGTTTAYGHFVYTGLVFQAAGRDAWLCLLIGTPLAGAILYLHMKLATKFPRRSVVQYSKILFGKWFGSVLGWVYIAFFLLVAALVIQELSIFMGLIYPKTPTQFFLVFEFLLVAWVVRAGGEVVTRVIQLLLPLLVTLGLFAMIFSLKDKDPTRLLPLLDHSFMSLAHGTLIYLLMGCDLIVFGMFYPDVTRIDKLPRNGFIAMPIAFFMFIGPATGPIMVFGQDLARVFPYPTYAEIQYIQIQGILERFDIAGILLWTMGAYIRASVYTLGAARGIAHLFHEQRETLYVLPTVAVVAGISLSFLPMSREEVHQFLYTSYPTVALFVGLGLPLLSLVMWLLRGRPRATEDDIAGGRAQAAT